MRGKSDQWHTWLNVDMVRARLHRPKENLGHDQCVCILRSSGSISEICGRMHTPPTQRLENSRCLTMRLVVLRHDLHPFRMISAVDSLKYLLLGAHVMLTVAPHQMSVADRIKTQRHRRQKTLACKAVPIFVGCFADQLHGIQGTSMSCPQCPQMFSLDSNRNQWHPEIAPAIHQGSSGKGLMRSSWEKVKYWEWLGFHIYIYIYTHIYMSIWSIAMSAQLDRSIERQGPLAQEQKGAHWFALGWACGFVIGSGARRIGPGSDG